MPFAPGDVVFLKSGGQSMTVAAVDDEAVECIWIGEEGEFFREVIPAVALIKAEDAEEEDDDEEDQEVDADQEGDEEEEANRKRRRKARR